MTQFTLTLAERMRQPDSVRVAASFVAVVGSDSWTISYIEHSAGVIDDRSR